MINEHKTMETLTADQQATKALKHVLSRVRDHSGVGYYMGYGTESFALATEALATLTGEDVLTVRKDYEPRSPKDPVEEAREKGPKKACLSRAEADDLEAIAAHLRKESGRTELMAGTVCDQCGYERHRIADQLDTWATTLNSMAYWKGGA